jgi:hypothetical protein
MRNRLGISRNNGPNNNMTEEMKFKVSLMSPDISTKQRVLGIKNKSKIVVKSHTIAQDEDISDT